MFDSQPSIDPKELRRRLDAAGYDTEQLDELSKALKVDLMSILAGWAPVLASLYPARIQVEQVALPPSRPKRPWWKRLLRLFIGLTEED